MIALVRFFLRRRIGCPHLLSGQEKIWKAANRSAADRNRVSGKLLLGASEWGYRYCLSGGSGLGNLPNRAVQYHRGLGFPNILHDHDTDWIVHSPQKNDLAQIQQRMITGMSFNTSSEA